MAKLEDILQQEVVAEVRGFESSAEAMVMGLLVEAQARADALKAARTKALEADRAAAVRRAESAAELLLSQARVQARGQIMDQVKAGLGTSLAAYKSNPAYPATLVKLAQEALASIGQAEALVVAPGDEAHLKAWAQQNSLELRTDPGLTLGVRVVGIGGKAQVQNSLPERLERAWDALSARAAQAIWG